MAPCGEHAISDMGLEEKQFFSVYLIQLERHTLIGNRLIRWQKTYQFLVFAQAVMVCTPSNCLFAA